jgi:hypothetical protein
MREVNGALLFAVVLVGSVLTTAGSLAFSRLRATAQSWAAAVAVLAYAALLVFRPAGLVSSNAAVLAVSIAAGTRLGRGLRSRGALLAFAITASVIDIVSFTTGPTRWLLGRGGGSAWEGIRYLAVSLPLTDGIVPVVGVGDLFVLALLFTGLRGLGVPFFHECVRPLGRAARGSRGRAGRGRRLRHPLHGGRRVAVPVDEPSLAGADQAVKSS